MADFDFTLQAAPIVGGAGASIGANTLVERADMALVSIATPLGGDEALAEALFRGWGLAFPKSTVTTVAGDTRAVKTTPDQMMLLFPHATADAESEAQDRLNGAGYTTDQTDSWVVLEIGGPETLSALERLCPVDAAGMPRHGSARTVMEHMGAILVRLGTDRFQILTASSSAQSFLHEVEKSFRHVSTGHPVAAT